MTTTTFPVRATYPAHLILLDLITLQITKLLFIQFLLASRYFKNRESSIGIATDYGPNDRGSRVRFSAGTGNFPPRHRVQTGFGTHPIFYPMGNVGSFPGRKAAGREAEYSSSSRTEVKECVDLYLRSPNTFSWRGA
jgi:hypothetical protein